MKSIVGFSILLLAASCSRTNAPSEPMAVAEPAKVGLGEVMLQVAHRFELLGRAMNANRFELAEFEAGELEELFEGDVPRAELPKEGPTAHIPAMAKEFLTTVVPDLKKAAASKNRAAFERSFASAAAACNRCHEAAEKGFIEVPSVPGRGVPELDPRPAPTASTP